METFFHTYRSPVNTYTALSVLNGANPEPVMVYEGRRCFVAGSTRKHGGPGRKFFNVYTIRFLDGDGASVPAGKFNSKAKLSEVLS